jgi:ribosomal protein L16 Arg81 hydroxylase
MLQVNSESEFTQIDVRSGLSLAEFKREYLRPGRPVVITDAMDDWNEEVFSFDSLGALCGDEEVRVHHYDADREFTPDDVSRRSLRELIDSCLQEDFKSFPYYMRDNWQLCDKYPELMDAHSVPEYFFDWFRLLPPFMRMPYPRIFIGPRGAVTPLHVDVWDTHAWLSQLEGRKRWLMFPPEDNKYLYDCAVRCESPDLERYPLYAKTSPLESTIGPGDTIFVPSKWAHWVESLEPAISLTYNYMGPGCFKPCLTNTFLDLSARVSRRLHTRNLAEA